MTLCHKKAHFKTGNLPGVPRHMNTAMLTADPETYIIDTPGVLRPGAFAEEQQTEVALRLAAAGLIGHKAVDPEHVVALLLQLLNQRQNREYLKPLNLQDPVDDPEEVALATARRFGMLRQQGEPDLTEGARRFIRMFQSGDFGRTMLDSVSEVESHSSLVFRSNLQKSRDEPKEVIVN
mmetsp:Transcript_28475/g.67379  ORF Transcript_28475/g.67379 Transcript_28475/m.67379 type:complete len:179 (+) Transcript_28475:434-970(+)